MKPILSTIFTSFFLISFAISIKAQNSIVGTWRVDSAYNLRLANGQLKQMFQNMPNGEKMLENADMKKNMLESLMDTYFIFDKEGVLSQQNLKSNFKLKYEIAKNGTILKTYAANDKTITNKILLLNEKILRIYFEEYKDTIQFTMVEEVVKPTIAAQQKAATEKKYITTIPDVENWFTLKADDAFSINFPVKPDAETAYGRTSYKVETVDSATSFSLYVISNSKNSSEVTIGDTALLNAFWEKSLSKRAFAMVSKQKGITQISNQYLFFKNAPAFLYSFQFEENGKIYEYSVMNIAFGNNIYVLTFKNELNIENSRWKDLFFNSAKF